MIGIFRAIGLALCLFAATAVPQARAHSRCDGDFERVGGDWVATRRCQEHEANKVARELHRHVTDWPSTENDVTPDEFCRGNNDIRVSTFCAAYKD